jgi:LysM repeat protein
LIDKAFCVCSNTFYISFFYVKYKNYICAKLFNLINLAYFLIIYKKYFKTVVMKKCFLFLILFSFCQNAFGQGNSGRVVDIVLHRVELGETIVMISKKYLVNPTTIYNSNKFIIDGVNEGMMLQIPVTRKAGQEFATMQYQEPVIGDTPSNAIASNDKKLDVNNEDDTEVVNNTSKAIVISEPEKTTAIVAAVETKEPDLESKKGPITRIEKDEEVLDITYEIQPRETLYSISKKYNIPMDVIMAQNLDILKNGIVAGLKIKIPNVKKETGIAGVFDNSKTLPDVVKTNSNGVNLPVADTTINGIVNHSITANETLYSLATKFNVSVEQLVAFNVNIEKNGLKVGDVIKIPTVKNGIVVANTNNVEIKKTNEYEGEINSVSDKTIDGIVNHTVTSKETLFSLSKQFNVSVDDLKSFNAEVLKNGLAIGSILKIPNANSVISKPETLNKTNADSIVNGIVNHTIATNETLFSLSKKFNVSVEDLKAYNSEILKNGFSIGLVIKIPATGTIIPKPIDGDKTIADVINKGIITHTVATNETLFSISKKYKTTIEELNAMNADLVKNGIAIGSKINIPTTKKVKDNLDIKPVADIISNGVITHTLASGETLYSLSKTYNVSVEQINAFNENLEKTGISIGATIKLPVVKAGVMADPNGIIAELDKKIAEFVMPTRTTESNEIIHKVVSKETLFSLSKKYNVAVYDIRSINESVLKNGLQIGQNIKIPVIKKAIPPSVNDDGLVVQTPGVIPTVKTDQGDALVESYVVGDFIMTVQQDDTLESIAKKFDVTPEEIIKNNGNLLKDGKVKTGQVIKVPASKAGAIEFSPETFD